MYLSVRIIVALVGFFSTGLGIGGGALLVPSFIHIGKLNYHRASSISLLMISLITLVGSIMHILLLKESFPLKMLIIFLCAASFGVYLGSLIIKDIPIRILTILFGTFLLLVGLKMLTGWHIVALSMRISSTILNKHVLISLSIFGILIGSASSILGVGCGLVIVPVCTLMLNFKIHTAITFSLISMVFITSFGAIQRYRKKVLSIHKAVKVAPFALIGAVAGAIVSVHLPAHILKAGFGIFMLFMGVQYIYKEIKNILINRTGEIKYD